MKTVIYAWYFKEKLIGFSHTRDSSMLKKRYIAGALQKIYNSPSITKNTKKIPEFVVNACLEILEDNRGKYHFSPQVHRNECYEKLTLKEYIVKQGEVIIKNPVRALATSVNIPSTLPDTSEYNSRDVIKNRVIDLILEKLKTKEYISHAEQSMLHDMLFN